MKHNTLLRLAAMMAIAIAMTPALFSQELVFEPDSIDFGRVPIGLAGLAGSYREVTITNRTNSHLTLHLQTDNLDNPQNFELFNPEVAKIHPILRQIYDAVGCYRQDKGEDPDNAFELAELGYLHIDEEIRWEWQFSLVGQDPIVQIYASNMRYSLIFDCQTGRFSTYEWGELAPVREVVVMAGNDKTFMVSYTPMEPEAIEGWMSAEFDDIQALLHMTGNSYYKEALELSTDEIDFGEIYDSRRVIRELRMTNISGIASRFEFEFSDSSRFYVFDPHMLDVHNFMLTIHAAFLKYREDNQTDARSMYQLLELGYINGEAPILEEWRFSVRSGDVEASSTELFELGRGYDVRFDMETEIYSGDGFDYSHRHRKRLGKDRSLDLLLAFAPNAIGEFEGEGRIMASDGDNENNNQEYVIQLRGAGLSVPDDDFILHPSSLSLSSFPSPFNSTAIVSFHTPYAGEVRVSLVDMNGRTMRNWTPAFAGMENGRTGEYRFAVNADGLAAGTYWVRVDQAGHSAQQRVVLVR